MVPDAEHRKYHENHPIAARKSVEHDQIELEIKKKHHRKDKKRPTEISIDQNLTAVSSKVS